MLRNKGKKVALLQVDEDGELARYFKSMKTYHNINIIVHNTGEDASFIYGKSETQIRHLLISQELFY